MLFLTRICHFLRMRTLIRRSLLILCSPRYVLNTRWNNRPSQTRRLLSCLKIIKQMLFSTALSYYYYSHNYCYIIDGFFET